MQGLYQTLRTFSYDAYAQGNYDEFLERLNMISKSGCKKLVELLQGNYRYTTITSIKKGERQKVFDLSMAEGEEPAFVANGIIVHNTHTNYAQAFQNNRLVRSTFSSVVNICTKTLSQVKLMDSVSIQLARSDGTVDSAFSGNYQVTAIGRHVSSGMFAEKLELTSQGMAAGSGDGV